MFWTCYSHIYLPTPGTNAKHCEGAATACLAGQLIPFGSAPSWGYYVTNLMGAVWIKFHSWVAVAWPSCLCWFGLIRYCAVSQTASKYFEVLPYQLIMRGVEHEALLNLCPGSMSLMNATGAWDYQCFSSSIAMNASTPPNTCVSDDNIHITSPLQLASFFQPWVRLCVTHILESSIWFWLHINLIMSTIFYPNLPANVYRAILSLPFFLLSLWLVPLGVQLIPGGLCMHLAWL